MQFLKYYTCVITLIAYHGCLCQVEFDVLNFTNGPLSGGIQEVKINNETIINLVDFNITQKSGELDVGPIGGDAVEDGSDQTMVLEGDGEMKLLDLEDKNNSAAKEHLELAFPYVKDLKTNKSLLSEESGYLRVANIEIRKVQQEGKYLVKVIQHPGVYRISKKQPNETHSENSPKAQFRPTSPEVYTSSVPTTILTTTPTPSTSMFSTSISVTSTVGDSPQPPVNVLVAEINEPSPKQAPNPQENLRMNITNDNEVKNNVGVVVEDRRSFDVYNLVVEPQKQVTATGSDHVNTPLPVATTKNLKEFSSGITSPDLAALLKKHFQVEEGLARELADIFQRAMNTKNGDFSATWTEWSVWSECVPHCGGRRRWNNRERFCVAVDDGRCSGSRAERAICPPKPCNDIFVPVWMLLLLLIVAILIVIVITFAFIIRRHETISKTEAPPTKTAIS
ncbi:hypothetical protein CAPTEDRAFT_192960 [Capitella teleta]|uniref:SEA domain-containing protein n=1 Tax=Capitella teleta TaxID=283909 RepID=R7TL22_CAPTE|nr:hypothetical protein CAPTEDRAFT_192960 [Capitella teleta]|eukprot:ELT94339.1 hypothetical protein CAPTEDRAFT_192960 [Capitella teleta]